MRVIHGGWIKLHRQLRSNPLWNIKPFSKGQAWVDILLRTNHADCEAFKGNQKINVLKGSFVTSEYHLMEDWGWSKTKVRAFLQLLQTEKMINKKTDRKKTTIFVLNWEEFQDPQTIKEPQKDHKKTNIKPQKNPNKNVKNDKNEKKHIYKRISELENSDLVKEAIKNFIEHRIAMEAPMNDRSFTLFLNRLIAHSEEDIMHEINYSIERGWKSVFYDNETKTREIDKKKQAMEYSHNYDIKGMEDILFQKK